MYPSSDYQLVALEQNNKRLPIYFHRDITVSHSVHVYNSIACICIRIYIASNLTVYTICYGVNVYNLCCRKYMFMCVRVVVVVFVVRLRSLRGNIVLAGPFENVQLVLFDDPETLRVSHTTYHEIPTRYVILYIYFIVYVNEYERNFYACFTHTEIFIKCACKHVVSRVHVKEVVLYYH